MFRSFFALCFLLSVPVAILHGADEASTFREAVQKAIAEKDWSAATSAAKKLRSALDKSERKEADDLLDEIKGRKALDKVIAKAFKGRDSTKPFAQVDKLRKKHADHAVLRSVIDRTRAQLAEAYFLPLDGFERRVDDGIRKVSGPGKTKQGRFAGHWQSLHVNSDAVFIFFRPVRSAPEDHSHLVFWMRSEKQTRCGVDLMPNSQDAHTYLTSNADTAPKQWTEIRLSLGPRGDFAPVMGATWKSLECVRLSKATGMSFDVLLDDFRLERKPKKAEKLFAQILERDS